MKIETLVPLVRKVLTAAVPGASRYAELVDLLIGLDDARTTQLKTIERKIDDIRDKDWRRGQELLREAAAMTDREPELLNQAKERFAEAHATYASDPQLSLWCSLYVATISRSENRPERALYWLRLAYDEALSAATAESKQIGRIKVGRIDVRSRDVEKAGSLVNSSANVIWTVVVGVGAALLLGLTWMHWAGDFGLGAIIAVVVGVVVGASSLLGISRKQ